MNRLHTRQTARFSMAVLLIVALLFGVAYQPTARAADISTNRLTNDKIVSANRVDGAVDLHLKNLNVAQVLKNKMAAYYPGNNTSTRIGGQAMGIQILTGKKGKVCNLENSLQGDLEVKIVLDGGVQKLYTVALKDVCNTNKFYGKTIDFPNGNLIDDASGFKKANITIGYSGFINADRLNKTIGNDLNYRIKLVGPRNSTAKLALLKKSDYDEFGLRSAYSGNVDSAPNKEVEIKVPFGYPCNTSSSIHPVDRTVKLYDADAGFGDTYMWVTVNGRELNRSEYNVGQFRLIDTTSFRNATKRWKVRQSDGTYNQLVITNAAVKPGDSYRLHVLNDGRNRRIDPHNNTLSVSIPNDSIYADVSCDFGLVPYVSVDPDVYAGNAALNVDGGITKNGDGDVPGNHPWEIYVVKYSSDPNRTIRGIDPAADACSYVSAVDRLSCSSPPFYSASYPASDSVDQRPYNDPVSDPPGTYTCFFTRVRDPTDNAGDDTSWRYSNMACAQAGKLPTIQVWGGDTRVGGNIGTSTHTIDTKLYGSWGEYGVFSDGSNSAMASGNGLYTGAAAGSTQEDWSKLTFANIDATNLPAFGNYGGVAASSISTTATTVYNTDHTFTSTDWDSGSANKRRVFYVEGTAFINGNLRYTGTFASIDQIPRIVIVADNIVIAPGVTQIDPWLIATKVSPTATDEDGNISTCSDVAFSGNYFVPFTDDGLLDTTTCDRQLTFNSPVIAKKIYLYRTAGANEDGAAEVFNLRGDVYLSSLSGTNTQPVATTDVIIELPPRF